ncbi:N-acetylmuramoyl-L-alanine amidase [Oerskovia enterophila]
MVAAGSLLLGGVVPSAPALAQGEVAQGSLEKSAAAPATVAGADGLEHPSIEPPDETPTTSLVESDLAIADVVPEVAPLEQVEPAEVRPEVEAPVLDAVESRAVAVDGANLVAVTWDGPAPERIEARSLSTSGDWSVWEVLELDPDEDGNGGGTDPWWTGGSATVEVRSWSDGQPADDRLTLVAITTEVTETDEQIAAVAPAGIGSASSTSAAGRFSAASSGRIAAAAPTAAEPAAAAAALAPSGPVVISRAQWGADPALLRWTPEYASTTLASVVHHTAGSNTYTPAQSAGIVRGIYTYHSQSRGWGDIGYNVLVDQYGQIFEGRAGGLTLPAIGAHAGGFNSGTFGVSMMGDYSTVAPSAAMKESVARIIAWRMGGTYRFNMWSVTTYTTPGHSTSRFSPGQQVGIYGILAHRDVAYTSCPGNAGYAILPELRNRVNQLVGAAQTPIYQNWAANGGASGPWGTVHQLEADYPGGTAAYFNTGYTLTYQPGVGVHAISPTIRPGWLAGAGFYGAGFPSSFEFAVGDGRGRAQEFSGTWTVIRSATSGSRIIGGDLRKAWWGQGGATGWLGYPTSNQAVVGDGRGTFIEFESTGTLLSTPTTGAAALSGDLRTEWWRTGGATGSLGYPNRTQQPIGDGRGLFVEFEKGGSIIWSPTTSARTISGDVRQAWWRSGGAVGVLGYPTTSQASTADGRGVTAAFERGAVASSPTTGTRYVYGSTHSLWTRTGGTNGYLGYPTTDQTGSGSDATVTDFEAGVSVVASARTGAREIWGPLRDKWRAAGGASALGIPDADPVNFTGVAGGYSSLSSGAWVVWAPSTGAVVVTSPFRAAWVARGGATGTLGLPLGDSTTAGGVTTQRFQGGTLTLRGGQVTG